MNFEWDPAKATANVDKHGVTFDEASTVFADAFALTIFDPEHSEEEDRFLVIGLSDQGRLLVVWHTDRDNTTRLIGARMAHKLETGAYNAERS